MRPVGLDTTFRTGYTTDQADAVAAAVPPPYKLSAGELSGLEEIAKGATGRPLGDFLTGRAGAGARGAEATLMKPLGPALLVDAAAATGAAGDGLNIPGFDFRGILSASALRRMAERSGPPSKFDQDALLEALAAHLGQNTVVRNPDDIDDLSRLPGRVMSAKEADALVARLAPDPTNPFVLEGCNAFAHLLCRYLQNEGYACGKVFAIRADESQHLQATAGSLTVDWLFHVGVAVYVQADAGVELRIIDPVTGKGARPPAEWIDGFRNGALVAVELTEAAQYKPRSLVGRQLNFAANVGPALALLEARAAAFEKIRDDRAAEA